MSKNVLSTDDIRLGYCPLVQVAEHTFDVMPVDEAEAEFDAWLAEHDREVKAEAWDEGALWAAVECRAIENENEVWITSGDNPYREEVTE